APFCVAWLTQRTIPTSFLHCPAAIPPDSIHVSDANMSLGDDPARRGFNIPRRAPGCIQLLPEVVVAGDSAGARTTIRADQAVDREARGGRAACEVNRDAAHGGASRRDVTHRNRE